MENTSTDKSKRNLMMIGILIGIHDMVTLQRQRLCQMQRLNDDLKDSEFAKKVYSISSTLDDLTRKVNALDRLLQRREGM